MKKNIVSLLVVVVLAVSLFVISSCDSGGNHHPTIAFGLRTDSISHSSSYLSLPRDTTFTLYIAASKTGPDGMLKNFKITRSINGGTDSTIINADIHTVYFSQYYSFKAGDSGEVQQYTFTVGNTEELYNSIQFVDTAR